MSGAVLSLALACPAPGQSDIIGAIAGGVPRPARSASSSLGSPVGVAVGATDNAYLASLNCDFKLDRNGVPTRIAGSYTAGHSGDGVPAIAPAGLLNGGSPPSDHHHSHGHSSIRHL
jgi:hypothetical protein